jgi:hypothetical protein
MKNKAGLVVLLVEIIAIVILHSSRSSRTEGDKQANLPSSQESPDSRLAGQGTQVAYIIK